MRILIIIGTIVLLASYFGVGMLKEWAQSRKLLDVPNERTSHTQPTPRGGGLVIFLATIIASVSYFAFFSVQSLNISSLAYLVGAASIALISWRDDVQSLPYWWRFAVHAGAALVALSFIGYWQSIRLPVIGAVELGWLGIPVTFFWIVGLTNAYNFMDGIDGLAGGQAVITALSWAVVGWDLEPGTLVAIMIFLAAASLGFLVHNWPPAKMFMGDVGSAFLGYTFAVAPLLVPPLRETFPVAAILLIWPFVFDTSFTLMRRLRNREKIFAAHRSHLYQRLVISGLSHQAVTLLYLSLALINSVLALSWILFASVAAAQAALVAFLLLQSFLLWRFVVRREQPAVQSRT